MKGAAAGAAAGSSPHTRGAHLVGRSPSQNHRIIPAYAGSTIRHPLRGLCRSGSSPHTRGARRRRPDPDEHWRIIPAYAGSTPAKDSIVAVFSDHPRIRGEHSRPSGVRPRWEGSSPHTRGARPWKTQTTPCMGIIPAYAGSTTHMAGECRFETDHPRIRGEHESSTSRSRPSPGSSPHTRGAHLQVRRHQAGDRIIPAYAGSTRISQRLF